MEVWNMGFATVSIFRKAKEFLTKLSEKRRVLILKGTEPVAVIMRHDEYESMRSLAQMATQMMALSRPTPSDDSKK